MYIFVISMQCFVLHDMSLPSNLVLFHLKELKSLLAIFRIDNYVFNSLAVHTR